MDLWKIFLVAILGTLHGSDSFLLSDFRVGSAPSRSLAGRSICSALLYNNGEDDFSVTRKDEDQRRTLLRRTLGLIAVVTTTSASTYLPDTASAAAPSLDKLLDDLKKAKRQMAPIPDLIQKEQWDSVRAVLITPPLSDLWTKSARPTSLLKDYAEAVGDNPAGDELAVLEAKEELLSHLRYLDMAVYNNVFNPIKTEGKTGATKELIRSYYEDPIIEFKASIKSLEELIQLGAL